MNRKILNFTVLLIITLSSLNLIGINAYPEIENYVYLENDDINMDNTSDMYQQHVVFSNMTKKWYIFYSRSDSDTDGVRYDILNYDGSLYQGNNIMGGGQAWSQYIYVDYDVRISFNGEKLYLFLITPTTTNTYLYCVYGILNEDSLEVDVGQITTLKSLYAYQIVNVMGVVTKLGYPACTYSVATSGSANSYIPKMLLSDSLTNFNIITSEIDVNSIGFSKTGVGFGADYKTWATMIGTLDNGLMIIHYDPSTVNHRISNVYSYWTRDYNVFLDGYAHADLNFDDVEPSTIYQYSRFDHVSLGYNYDGDIILIMDIWTGDPSNQRSIKYWRWNNIAENWYADVDIDTVISDAQHESIVTVNDRGIFNIVSVNLTDNNLYVFRWNKTSSVFNDEVLLWEYSLIDDSIIRYKLSGNNYIPNFGGLNGNGTLGTILIDGVGAPTIDLWLSFYGLDQYVFPPLPINYIKLDNITNNMASDYGVLLFPNEEHNIEINVKENVTFVYVEIEDAENVIRFNYNITSNKKYTTITNKKSAIPKNIAYITTSSIVDNVDNVTISMDFKLNDDILDYYAKQLKYGLLYEGEWFNFTSQIKYSIFNLGGIPVYSGSGDYIIYSDNDIFSIGAYNDGSWIRFDVLYNKLQHMHFNVELDIDGDWDSSNGIWVNCTGGLFEYGMDYFIEDELLEGWKVVIYPSSVVVGHQNLGVDFDYIQWTIDHYFYNRTLEDYQLVIYDKLYSNFEGYDNEDSIPDYHNRTSTTYWFDMWFSNDNSSRKVATRVNAEWYGMYEQGTSWWFGYGAFRPVIGELTNSIFYDNVYDVDGEITTIKGNVNLVRFWGRVEKVTGGNKKYIMHNYLMKNKIFALNEMIGVDIPPLVETKVMDMPQTGFLAPLIKALSGIKDYIISGIIYLLMILATAFDGILVSLGLPPILSILITLIISVKDIFMLMIDVIPSLATYSLTIMRGIFDILFLVIGRWMMLIPLWFASINKWITMFIDFFTGKLFDINIWKTFMLEDFLYLGITILFPLWWIDHVLSSEHSIQTFIDDIKTFYGLLTGILNIFLWGYNIIASIISIILGLK